jgi:hypothetical protein
VGEIGDLIELKKSLARQLNVKFFLSEGEKTVLRLVDDKRKKEIAEFLAAEKIRKQEEWLAREKARREKLASILSRSEIKAFDEDGKRLHGIPVSGEEWQILPTNTPVILINEGEKSAEAFFVKKTRGGRCEKGLFRIAFLEKPQDQANKPLTEAKILYFDINGSIEEVAHVSGEGLAALRQLGLNSGTMVAIGKPDDKGQLTIVRLEVGECFTVGAFLPL